MEIYKTEFIEFMVKSDVLKFGEFVTKSGRKSPYFINAGNYRTGAQTKLLGDYYADAIHSAVKRPFNALFGPAYKGIPLATSAAAALYSKYGIDTGFFFNRKEAKDHGEGGVFVGYKPQNGDRIIIIEDVITAGTAVRETLPLLKAAANCTVEDMIISVDRMEKGVNGITAVNEIKRDFGITVHSIVNIKEIVAHLHNREVGGKIYITDEIKKSIDEYLLMYAE